MKIIYPQELISLLKDRFLLLDTSFFIDSFIYPVEFAEFVNILKDNGCDLVTADPIILEFLKGASNEERYNEKWSFLEEIIDSCLPITKETFECAKRLLIKYREDGKNASIADLILAGLLDQYSHSRVFLLSKNTNDFPLNIFNQDSYILLSKSKALQVYGVYSIKGGE